MKEINHIAISNDSRTIYISLNRNGKVLEKKEITGNQKAAEDLLPRLTELLAAGKLRPAEIAFISYIYDTGSLSSLRVINSLVRGLSRAAGIRLCGVSGFELMMHGVRLEQRTLILTSYNRQKVLAKVYRPGCPLDKEPVLALRTSELPGLFADQEIKTLLIRRTKHSELSAGNHIPENIGVLYASDNEHQLQIDISLDLFNSKMNGPSPAPYPQYPENPSSKKHRGGKN